MSKLTLILLWIVFSIPSYAGEGLTYHKVIARSGDGVFSMLRRYQLENHSCNINTFYQLNGITPQDHLFEGRQYELPIIIYTYDGTSIRSTIDNPDYDNALKIAHFNNELSEKGIKKGYYQKDKILWVPIHLKDCNSSTPAESKLEKAKEFIIDPLLGKEYERVELVDKSLKGKVFYVISGHGGPDPGAQAKKDNQFLNEDEYAYDVALRLYRKLISHGAAAHMIIQDADDGIRDELILKGDHDEKCLGKSSIPLNQKIRLDQRTQAVNHLYKKYKKRGLKDQYAISIHVDSRSISHRQDVFFYHYKGSKSGKILAEQVLETFRDKYKINRRNGQYAGTVTTRDLYVLKYTRPTAIFVELANIKNLSDQKRILYATNRQALADWLFLGMTKNF